jgi:hypothetical protein
MTGDGLCAIFQGAVMTNPSDGFCIDAKAFFKIGFHFPATAFILPLKSAIVSPGLARIFLY